jgi:DNA invertase Pin-like site-specific DNA recombinase
MLRSQTVNTIHDIHAQGKSVQEIAIELSISRTTVRKYLKHPDGRDDAFREGEPIGPQQTSDPSYA